jgi:hypothetical protein
MGASKLGEASGANPSAVLWRVIWTSTDGKPLWKRNGEGAILGYTAIQIIEVSQ